jgi:hypothetical protein
VFRRVGDEQAHVFGCAVHFNQLRLEVAADQSWICILLVRLAFTSAHLADFGCDYREFRPHLNQHPCGALIAHLVEELATVPTIALDLED